MRDQPVPTTRGRGSARLRRLFGALEPGTLRDLEAAVEWRTIHSGETLFRHGDPADAAYVVASGRLRVVVSAEDGERVLSEIGPGEMLGEMALLTGDDRSATVYAVRDSCLARISRASFDALIARSPEAMVHVSRVMAERLRYKARGAMPATSTTIALVPAGPGVPLDDVARRLARALAAHGASDLLTPETVDAAIGERGIARGTTVGTRLLEWFDEREARFRYLLYRADPELSPWTERCLRQADHLLIVADAGADPAPGPVETRLAARSERSARRSLVLLERGAPAETARWLAPRDLDRHFHLRLDRDADYARLTRHLTGTAVGVVLGGGGARGAAHIGVLRALAERGVEVDLVGGTSMGAIMAGLFALGQDPDEMVRTCRRGFVALRDYTLPTVSLLRGRRIERACRATFGDRRIEDLRIPFFAVSTNLTRAEEVIHRRGPVLDAVLASIAIPGILPPAEQDGDVLVDGGLLNNVPVDVMRRLCGAGTVIAVDVSQAVELRTGASGLRRLWHRLVPGKRRAAPGIMDILQRAAQVPSVASRNRTRELADLYLEIPVDAWKMLEFEAVEAIADHGYRVARERLADWHRV